MKKQMYTTLFVTSGNYLFRLGVMLALLGILNVAPLVNAEVLSVSAIPVAKGEIIAGTEYQYASIKEEDSSPANFEFESSTTHFGLAYGITEKLTLGLLVPILSLKAEFNTPFGRSTLSPMGLGDISAGIRYTAYQWDAPGKTFRIAPIVALKMPTGDDDNMEPGIGLSPIQLGSGSWDPTIAVSSIYQTLTWQVDFEGLYTFKTEANNLEGGDLVTAVLGFFHTVFPWEISSSGNLFAGVEFALGWSQKNEMGGLEDPNSGGISFVIAPILQYRVKAVKINFYFVQPVFQDLNGNGAEIQFVTGSQVIISF